jgi:predicted transposase/invertase (TIGR01784 family)
MGLGFLQDILWYNKDSIKQSDEEKLRNILEEITGKKEVENIMGTFGEKYFNVGVEKGIIIGIEKGIEKGIERGVRLGREEGREEGIEWGIEKEKYEIAKRMLDLNVQIEMISLVTGLSEKQILKLR